MHSIRPVSFCFHLFLISAAILVAVAVPTNHTRHEPSEDLCEVGASGRSMQDMRNLENKGHCRYKVCEDKFGNKHGRTRNPDVIYRIICQETTDCKQVYLTVEVVYSKGSLTTDRKKEKVPTGCLYSERDLRDFTTVEATEPFTVS